MRKSVPFFRMNHSNSAVLDSLSLHSVGRQVVVEKIFGVGYEVVVQARFILAQTAVGPLG